MFSQSYLGTKVQRPPFPFYPVADLPLSTVGTICGGRQAPILIVPSALVSPLFYPPLLEGGKAALFSITSQWSRMLPFLSLLIQVGRGCRGAGWKRGIARRRHLPRPSKAVVVPQEVILGGGGERGEGRPSVGCVSLEGNKMWTPPNACARDRRRSKSGTALICLRHMHKFLAKAK